MHPPLSSIPLACALLCGCAAASPAQSIHVEAAPPDYKALPLRADADNYNAVVEIPAGSNHKREYDAATNTFPVEQVDGRDRIVAFLPYPANYGFLPGTLMDKARGGDGDALDVLVVAESAAPGSVLKVQVVAVLRLLDGGEADDKIIAVPSDPALQVVGLTDGELPQSIRTAVEHWFVHYKGPGRMVSNGWGGRADAEALIERWRL